MEQAARRRLAIVLAGVLTIWLVTGLLGCDGANSMSTTGDESNQGKEQTTAEQNQPNAVQAPDSQSDSMTLNIANSYEIDITGEWGEMWATWQDENGEVRDDLHPDGSVAYTKVRLTSVDGTYLIDFVGGNSNTPYSADELAGNFQDSGGTVYQVTLGEASGWMRYGPVGAVDDSGDGRPLLVNFMFGSLNASDFGGVVDVMLESSVYENPDFDARDAWNDATVQQILNSIRRPKEMIQ
ncbi:MAG: hypothetical protein LBO07_02855 [Coriobacteriales bacterium]|jgi:hypothetical protein|nr:hypothetical protein [Coriobacteriales bacterium]